MTPEIKAALDHVKSIYPDVTHVTYGRDHRWHYRTNEGKHPKFDQRIDVNILEQAADSLETVPATFYAEP